MQCTAWQRLSSAPFAGIGLLASRSPVPCKWRLPSHAPAEFVVHAITQLLYRRGHPAGHLNNPHACFPCFIDCSCWYDCPAGLGIPLATLDEQPKLDVAIDGADEASLHACCRACCRCCWCRCCACACHQQTAPAGLCCCRPAAHQQGTCTERGLGDLSQAAPTMCHRSKHALCFAVVDALPQVDPNLDVVKGRGGALLREKVGLELSCACC